MKTRGANYFVLRPDLVDRYFLVVTQTKAALQGTGTLQYILYGEQLGLHERATFASKRLWYSMSLRAPADLILPCGVGATFFCALNRAGAVASNSFTEIRLHESICDRNAIWAWMNSAFAWLHQNTVGRAILGGGMLKLDPFDYRLLPVARPGAMTGAVPVLDRQVGDLSAEIAQPDRRALDDIIFDVLGLTQGERDAVYEAVIRLVEQRLSRAESLGGRRRQATEAEEEEG